MPGVVTVTANPALDRTVWLDVLVPGATNRAVATDLRIGGKGVNVARAVARAGVPATALGFAGHGEAAGIEAALGAEGITARFHRVAGDTRVNLKLIERRDGRMTEVNEPGPAVGTGDLAALEDDLAATAARASVAVLSGSLPPGAPAGTYAAWTRRLASAAPATAVVVDASGAALREAVAASPFLVKPNADEAADLLGRPVDTVEDAVAAAVAICGLGPRAVLLSLGALGAVAAAGGAARHVPAAALPPDAAGLRTTVGAGDALVARLAVVLAGSPVPADPALVLAHAADAVGAAGRQILEGRP